MRRIATLLSTLLASSVLFTSQALARMSSTQNKKTSAHGQMASQVDFQTFDIDGQVHDLMWCGYQDEIVLLHTTDGTIYRSRDRGLSWKRLRNLLHKQGIQVADEDQEVSRVDSYLLCKMVYLHLRAY